VVFDKAWILGAVLCKLLLYGQIVTLASTTFILTSMSLDRYLAICHPIGSFALSRSRPKVMIIVSWLLAFVFASPQLAIFTQVRHSVTEQTSPGQYPLGLNLLICWRLGVGYDTIR